MSDKRRVHLLPLKRLLPDQIRSRHRSRVNTRWELSLLCCSSWTNTVVTPDRHNGTFVRTKTHPLPIGTLLMLIAANVASIH